MDTIFFFFQLIEQEMED